MATSPPNILSVNLVLVGVELLQDPAKFEAFRSASDPDLQIQMGFVAEVPTGLTGQNRRVHLNRDRVILELSPTRSSVSKQYPDSRQDLELLTQTADLAIRNTDFNEVKPRAFGFNIELVYDQHSGDPATKYIGDRLFGGLSLGEDGWSLVGGTGHLIFNDKNVDRLWIINVQPRANDDFGTRIFLAMNLHNNVVEIPSKETILSSLTELWDEAHAFALRLDDRSHP